MRPRKVLMFLDYYLPGFKAGGPVRAVSNLVDLLGDQFEFYLVTRDHDLTDKKRYPEIMSDEWVKVGKASTKYLRRPSFWRLWKALREINPDIIHLGSFFSRMSMRVLALRRMGLTCKAAVILAPRGEFSPGALSIKRRRKTLYMLLSFKTKLFRDVLWHATSPQEKRDIERILLSHARTATVHVAPSIHVASDVVAEVGQSLKGQTPRTKQAGTARFVFLSRISPKKNLAGAIKLVGGLKGQITLDIFGPIDDPEYWAECQRLIERVPASVSINYRGSVRHEDTHRQFAEHDFFLFPTLGENFGYVILEALGAGCPVLLSDQTPWGELENNRAGWTIPLQDEKRWSEVLKTCLEMGEEERLDMSLRSRRFLKAWLD